MDEREGVIFFFNVWAPVLKLGNKTVGRYTRAAYMYARWGRTPQDFASEVKNPLWIAIRESINEQMEERD